MAAAPLVDPPPPAALMTSTATVRKVLMKTPLTVVPQLGGCQSGTITSSSLVSPDVDIVTNPGGNAGDDDPSCPSWSTFTRIEGVGGEGGGDDGGGGGRVGMWPGTRGGNNGGNGGCVGMGEGTSVGELSSRIGSMRGPQSPQSVPKSQVIGKIVPTPPSWHAPLFE